MEKLVTICKRNKIFISDDKYIYPDISDVKKLLRDTFFEKYKYVSDKFECNQFEKILAGFVTQWQYKEGHKLPWKFGIAWTRGGKHCVNIVETDDCVYLIEPQNDKVWEASVEDQIVFIFI